jgi:regulatory protein
VRRRKPDPAAAALPADPQAARLAALKLLNRRDYGVRELAARLVARGFERTAVDEVIAALVCEKLLDDARYARHFVSYHADRGRGPVRIAHLLREAGVAAEDIAGALEPGAAEWRRRCAVVRRKRFGERLPATWSERGRQARFLTQRGFSAEQVRAAIGKDFDEDG